MRIFRIRQRLPGEGHLTGKHRDYLGEIKLRKFGKETYIRYNSSRKKDLHKVFCYTAELCEFKNNRWEVLSKKETKLLLE